MIKTFLSSDLISSTLGSFVTFVLEYKYGVSALNSAAQVYTSLYSKFTSKAFLA